MQGFRRTLLYRNQLYILRKDISFLNKLNCLLSKKNKFVLKKNKNNNLNNENNSKTSHDGEGEIWEIEIDYEFKRRKIILKENSLNYFYFHIKK